MVVHDFNVMRVLSIPNKTDAPLIVYSDGMLPFPVSAQGFQVIPRRVSEIVDARGLPYHHEFGQRPSLQINGQLRTLSVPDLDGHFSFKRLYHLINT